jgi:hypothetical protein
MESKLGPGVAPRKTWLQPPHAGRACAGQACGGRSTRWCGPARGRAVLNAILSELYRRFGYVRTRTDKSVKTGSSLAAMRRLFGGISDECFARGPSTQRGRTTCAQIARRSRAAGLRRSDITQSWVRHWHVGYSGFGRTCHGASRNCESGLPKDQGGSHTDYRRWPAGDRRVTERRPSPSLPEVQ